MITADTGGERLPSPAPHNLNPNDNNHYSRSDVARNSDLSAILQIMIDQREVNIPAAQLGDPVQLSQLREMLGTASFTTVVNAEAIIDFPPSLRDKCIELVTASLLPEIEFSITGGSQTHRSLLDALFTLPLGEEDLHRIAEVTETLITSAATFGDGAVPQAAQSIKTYLDRNHVACESASVLRRMIRQKLKRNANGYQDKENPQRAADLVLQAMQSERVERGEDISASPPLRTWKGDFYRWDRTRWVQQGSMQVPITQALQKKLDGTPITNAFVESVLLNIRAKTELDYQNHFLPVLLSEGQTPSAERCEYISLGNGNLDLQELREGNAALALKPHEPRVFGAPPLDPEYDPNATCPLFESTLAEIFPTEGDNDHRIEVVIEAMGYALMPWFHSLETAFVFHGHGANGKSLLMRILEGLLGSGNVSHVPLDGFQEQFRIGQMVGKLANIATDMPRMQKVQEGLLKQLVSGEPVQVNQKYKEPATRTPTAKLFFATNILPPFSDSSDGLWRRLRVIPFYRQFREELRDPNRAQNIIDNELPGILNLALAGAQRILARERFTECEVCRVALDAHRQESDPLRAFIEEKCDRGSEFSVRVDDFYQSYRSFCMEINRPPKAKTTIGSELKVLLDFREPARETTGDRKRLYPGIRLATASDPTVSTSSPRPEPGHDRPNQNSLPGQA